MTPKHQRSIGLVALISAIATAMPTGQALADTTRFDTLANAPFVENRPTAKTTRVLKDELLFQRATQAYLWALPLINTLILLCSGAAATWAHHALVHENNRKDLQNGLILAIVLGVLFTAFQIYEYTHAAFGFAGNIYGANFFMATGFHGFHVLIGTIFLAVCLFRVRKGHFTPERHVGFEAAAWYWHFVDVVWLFLFASIYIWGQ
jgi:heme/copper-type cytochrome/quinol oxidase subunit 3